MSAPLTDKESMLSYEQYSQAQSLLEVQLRSVADLARVQRDLLNAALANSTVITRQMCNAVNGTGVLFLLASEQMQGLFNRTAHKSLE